MSGLKNSPKFLLLKVLRNILSGCDHTSFSTPVFNKLDFLAVITK